MISEAKINYNLENPGFLESSFSSHNQRHSIVNKGEITQENGEQNIYRTIGEHINKSG